MTNLSQIHERISLQEFIQRYEVAPFEFADGESFPIMPTTTGHNHISDNLMWALNNVVRPRQLGKIFPESPYVLTDARDWVKGARVPDVMFVTKERYARFQRDYLNWENEPLRIVPDLVVEIISPTDTEDELNTRIRRYSEDGVRLIWVIRPPNRIVEVYALDSQTPIILQPDKTLTGGDVLPGFEMLIANLFA